MTKLKIEDIDWSKAPEGTTHIYDPDKTAHHKPLWRKKEKDGLWHTWDFLSNRWAVIVWATPEVYIERPVAPAAPVWDGKGVPPLGAIVLHEKCEWVVQFIGDFKAFIRRVNDKGLAVNEKAVDFHNLHKLKTKEELEKERQVSELRVNLVAIVFQLCSAEELANKLHTLGYRLVKNS